MLPPQIQSSLSASKKRSLTNSTSLSSRSSIVRVSALHTSARCCGWRQPRDYASHLDPLFHRFSKSRSIKTKAKLLEKIRRRGKFDWDANQKPFFTPRHIRWASHWNGKPPCARWPRAADEEVDKKKDGKVVSPADEGYELSQREKEWKEQMEAMRKRIQQDPYEAIFGKRFEPFWSPLVPSWMREEMGLQGWGKVKDVSKAKNSVSVPEKSEPTMIQSTRTPYQALSESLARLQPTRDVFEPSKTEPKQSSAESKADTKPTTEPAAYASFSSTSWDSWTKKARRTEWDSSSGQTKRWEYDPISNRMVQIAGPKAVEPVETKQIEPVQSEKPAKRANDTKSLINTPLRELDPKAVEIPVKKSTEFRTAIPIPSQAVVAEQKMDVGPTPATQASGKNMSSAPKPAALAKLPENDLDLITADNVRARMGKLKNRMATTGKPTTPAEKAAMEAAFDKKAAEPDADLAATLEGLDAAKKQRQALEVFETRQKKRSEALDSERSLFNMEKQTRELAEIEKRMQSLAESYPYIRRPTTGRVETSVDRANAMQAASRTMPALQPAVERMQTKELPKVAEPDDAAAHESTEPLESSGVPKDWATQADLLQADRVKRTASKRPYPMTRWIDEVEARKAAYQAAKAPTADEQAAAAEKSAKLEKANALLEAEVKEQKFLMQSHETRYAHKIRNLRQELDAAYKQSAVHSEMHVDRIKALETELGKAQKAAGDSAKTEYSVLKKQDPLKAMQGEGDFCTNVTKYADSTKWYKRPAIGATLMPAKQETANLDQKARDQSLVKEVREIYEKQYGVIDTNHRQPMEQPKKNPVAELMRRNKPKQLAEAEPDGSDVALGEALAKHEKTNLYRFRQDNLEAELKKEAREAETSNLENKVAAQEQQAHEAQALMAPENADKMRQVIADELKPRQPLPGPKLVNDRMPKLIPAELNRQRADSAKDVSESAVMPSSVRWEEPPVYKVLAYDSGNDTFSTATTTSNFTGSETPISIPQALSQLYQPARFVPHFADLQKDGYQVIYGTRDLLVFKKVQSQNPVVTAEPVSSSQGDASLVDHGLLKPKENALAEEAANFYDKYQPEPKPYDPTSIENGKLMPYENALAQEAANFYDRPKAAASVNPIDGTAKTAPGEGVSTGNFASPTGFVNHDRIFLDEDEDVEYRHYPRVRREEPVFSGTRRAGRAWNKRHERHQSKLNQGTESTGRKRRGGAAKWFLSVGLGAVVVAYGVGVAAETARQTKVEKERWQQILEGKRGRWE